MPPILVQTPHFVVLNKPPGMPVHAGPAGATSVEDFFPALSRRRDGPWLAHRLDADTSGCLVIALRKAALIAAQAEFAAGRARKTYWAIVHGTPQGQAGQIDTKLAKISHRSGWRIVPDPAGQPALTEWRVLGQGAGRSLLELRPHTGRTHQIRVHCALLGHPLIGDPIYGAGDGPLQLLSRSITLDLTPILSATAPPAAQMVSMLEEMGSK